MRNGREWQELRTRISLSIAKNTRKNGVCSVLTPGVPDRSISTVAHAAGPAAPAHTIAGTAGRARAVVRARAAYSRGETMRVVVGVVMGLILLGAITPVRAHH